jgi:hypothetical protein
MEIIGYIASLLVGVSLGLIGAGGSILTVPVMVYLFHVPVLVATSYSLFIVGITSMLGAGFQYKQDNVDAKVAVIFCLASLTVVSLIRNYVMPAIPSQLFEIRGVPVTSALVSMVLFSLLMMAAAYAMIRRKPTGEALPPTGRSSSRLWLCGIVVGLVTGFLGAGGGFILIPSLVLLLGLPMKKAIGTSLLIIALNSLAGFALDLHHVVVQWHLLGYVTLVATAGILIGMTGGKKIPAQKLKLSFGWFVMALGIVILLKELASFVIKIEAGHNLTGLMKLK